MMSRVKVDPTCDCPLAAKAFDWVGVAGSREQADSSTSTHSRRHQARIRREENGP